MKKALIAIITCFVFFSVNAQKDSEKMDGATKQFSLKQAQEFALQNNKQVLNAGLDAQIAQKKIWEYKSMGLPQLGAKVNYQHIFKVPEMSLKASYLYGVPVMDETTGAINYMEYNMGYVDAPIQLGSADNTTIDMTASQMIFSGEFFVGLKTAKVYKELMEKSFEKSQIDIQEAVRSSYYSALIASENKKTLDSNLEILEKTLSDLKAMNKVGMVDETSVDQLELNVSNIRYQITSLDRFIVLAHSVLKLQLGLTSEETIELTDKLEALLTELNMENLGEKEFSPESNINYKLVESQEKFTDYQVKLAKASYLPSAAAFYRHQEQVNAPAFNFSSPDVVGITLNVPICSSGQRWSKVQQAKMELEKVTNNKTMLSESIVLQYNEALIKLNNAKDQYQSQKQNMELSKRIYDKMLIRFNEGLASSMELTQAQQQYTGTQSAYFIAIHDLLNAKSKLDQVMNN